MIKGFNSHLTLTKIKNRILKIKKCVCVWGGGGKYGPNHTRPFAFSQLNTKKKNHVLKISVIFVVVCSRAIADIFNTFNEINLVFTLKSRYPLFILQNDNPCT